MLKLAILALCVLVLATNKLPNEHKYNLFSCEALHNGNGFIQVSKLLFKTKYEYKKCYCNYHFLMFLFLLENICKCIDYLKGCYEITSSQVLLKHSNYKETVVFFVFFLQFTDVCITLTVKQK